MRRSLVERLTVDAPPGAHDPNGAPRLRKDGRPRKAYPVKWVMVVLGAAGLLLIGGPYLFINLFLGSAPGRLHLPTVPGASAGIVAGPVSGDWTVGPGSIAGYRVQEILFGQSHTAVGRTSDVTGSMVVSGTEVTAAEFKVKMSTVKSDQGARDAQFRGFIMDTADYPYGTFRLTSPVRLGSVPAIGSRVSVPATGQLTLRGVTRAVTFTLSAERLQGAIDVNAEIPLDYGRWHIPNPSFAVARLGKKGTVEVLLHLVPADSPAAKAHPTTTTTVFVPGTF